MLRYVSYDIVFQEIPGEVTLALNLSGCPNHCPGCHSPHLWQDIGEVLDEDVLTSLLQTYGNAVTCVCFMGGDAASYRVEQLARFVREEGGSRLKIGWYSGKSRLPLDCSLQSFNYLKLGPYVECLGGLDSGTTNQRFYQVVDGELVDKTMLFAKRKRGALMSGCV